MISTKHILSLTIVFAAVMALAPACVAGSYVLLVEQTPIEGGVISPGVGVHSFTPGEMVTLTATPRSGYQFVRWVGDVSATDTSTTTVTLDAPKMLVAVFERVEYALLSAVEEIVDEGAGGAGGGGGGGLTRQNPAIGGGGGANPSGSPMFSTSSFTPPVPPEEEDDDTGGDIPVPTPEPGTIAMMILGATIVRWRKS